MRKAVYVYLGLGRATGGGEYTTLTNLELLKETGFSITLICKRVPKVSDYLRAFNTGFSFDEIAIFNYPRLIRIMKLYHYLFYPLSTPNIAADLYFIGSADSHPFVIPPHAILYYKPVVYYIIALPLTPPWHVRDYLETRINFLDIKWFYKRFFGLLSKNYWKRLNALFIACSKYVASIVNDCLGVKPEIVYTPIDFEKYRWRGEDKKNYVVVMGRLTKSKRYEDAIIACKEAKVKLIMLLSMQDKQYYRHILRLIKREHLEDKVKIILNAPLQKRASILRKAKVFVHTRIEAGAKAVREAMAAGCIPVVPKEGGQSEFVPKEFTYSRLTELPNKIIEALEASDHLSYYMVEEAKKYDKEIYKLKLRNILEYNGVI